MTTTADAEQGMLPNKNNAVVLATKQSLRQQISDAHAEQGLGFTFFLKLCGICFGSIACFVVLILFSVIPITMIFYGAANLSNCTVQPFIPVFLLIGGICLLIDQCAHGFIFCFREKYKVETKSSIGMALDTFTLIWFFIGSIFVYKVNTPNYDPALGEFCHRGTFLLAYWIVTLAYIFFGLVILACCSMIFFACFCIDCIDTSESDEGNKTRATDTTTPTTTTTTTTTATTATINQP